MLKRELQKLGLNRKEAVVYAACLEVGHGSAHRIAQQANLPKSTTYDTLKALVNTGLVKTYLKKSRKYFTASDPKTLNSKLNQQSKVLESIMPELQGLYHDTVSRKPKLRFYDGKLGVKVTLNEMLLDRQSVIGITSADVLFAKLSEYFPSFPKERAKRGIPVKLIMRDGPIARERQASGPKELREVKIIDTDIPFESAIFAWQHKLAMMTLGEDITVSLIESRDLSTTFRAMFELLWTQN